MSLDDSVSRFLPSLPEWADRVRVRHLLTYGSGLPPIRKDSVTGDADILDDLQSVTDLLFEPGTAFLYSNNNAFVRRVVIEAVTGMNYGHFVRKRLFGPCGMEGAVIDPAPGAVPIPGPSTTPASRTIR